MAQTEEEHLSSLEMSNMQLLFWYFLLDLLTINKNAHRIAPALCEKISQEQVKSVKKQRALREGKDHHIEESSN